MEVKFIPITRKEYTVLRDYFVSNDHLQGIEFILYDEEENRLLKRFVKHEDITNEQNWKKRGFWKNEYFAQLVEKGKGKENRVIVEQGTLQIRKKTKLGDVSDKKKPAERVTFFLAPSIFKPF